MLRKFPVKNAIRNGLIAMELTGAAMAAPLSVRYSEPVQRFVVKIGDNTEKDLYDSTLIQKQIAEINKIMLLRINKLTQLKRQQAMVLQIMREDKNCCTYVDKKKLAENIVKCSNEYGADPIHIACIVKQESHFTENVNKKSGKGLMQLTQIAVKDMYVRPNLYHPGLKKIKEKYPTYEKLFAAIQTDPELNLRVGIIAFIQRLENASGNVRIALQNYNGSSGKIAYANEIMKNIKQYNLI